MRPKLFGYRDLKSPSPGAAWALHTWLPVAVMVGVIARESTQAFSSHHTSAWLRAIVQAIFGVVSDDRWEVVHHYLRKSGHFFGYGLLGVSFLRAWLISWAGLLRHRAAFVWLRYCLVMAVFCTALVASADELHQTFLPDRTGIMTDVLLDTCGAACLMAFSLCRWRPRESQKRGLRETATSASLDLKTSTN